MKLSKELEKLLHGIEDIKVRAMYRNLLKDTLSKNEKQNFIIYEGLLKETVKRGEGWRFYDPKKVTPQQKGGVDENGIISLSDYPDYLRKLKEKQDMNS